MQGLVTVPAKKKGTWPGIILWIFFNDFTGNQGIQHLGAGDAPFQNSLQSMPTPDQRSSNHRLFQGFNLYVIVIHIPILVGRQLIHAITKSYHKPFPVFFFRYPFGHSFVNTCSPRRFRVTVRGALPPEGGMTQ